MHVVAFAPAFGVADDEGGGLKLDGFPMSQLPR